MIQFGKLPNCEACTDESKQVKGILFDLPEPGEKTMLYDCKNQLCKQRKQNAEQIVLCQARAEREGWDRK